MAAYLSDSFTGSNGTLLSAHAPEIGGAWVFRSGSPGVNDWQLSNGAARPTSASFSSYYNSATLDTGDIAIEASITRVISSGVFTSLLFRFGDAGFYRLDINSNNVQVVRVESGYAAVTVQNVASQQALNTSYKFRIECEGTAIRVFRDAVLIIDTADAPVNPAILSQSQVGLLGQNQGKVDTLSAEKYVAPLYALLDKFSGTNGTLLQSHLPDIGQGWEKFYNNADSNFFDLNNGSVIGDAGGVSYYYNTTDLGTANYTLSGTFTRETTDQFASQFVFRYVDGGTHYRLDVYDGAVSLVRVDFANGGGVVILQSVNLVQTTGVAYQFKVVVSDNTFDVYRSGVLLFSYTDAPTTPELATSRFVGLGGGSGTRIDNYAVAVQQVTVEAVGSALGGTAVQGIMGEAEWDAATLIDNFVDVPGTPLENHLPDAGSKWLDFSTHTATILDGGGIRGNSLDQAFYGNAASATDFDIQFEIKFDQGSDSATFIQFRVRENGDQYQLRLDASEIELWQIVGGGGSIVKSDFIGSARETWYTFKLEVRGYSVKLYRDRILVLDAFDDRSTAYQGAGSIGLGITDDTSLKSFWFLPVNALRSGDGSAGGSATVIGDGVGLITRDGVGAAQGVAAVTGIGLVTATGYGSSAGVATVQAEGIVLRTVAGDGTAHGSSAVVGVGRATKEAQGVAEGAATASAESNSLAAGEGIGEASGSSTVVGRSEVILSGKGEAHGSASASGRALVTLVGRGSSSGEARVNGVSATVSPTEPVVRTSTGFARGIADVRGYPVLPVSGTGRASGSSHVIGVGAATKEATGAAEGHSTAVASGTSILSSIGVAVGEALVRGIAIVIPVDTEVPPDRTAAVPSDGKRIVVPKGLSRLIFLLLRGNRLVIAPDEGNRTVYPPAMRRVVNAEASRSRIATPTHQERNVTP